MFAYGPHCPAATCCASAGINDPAGSRTVGKLSSILVTNETITLWQAAPLLTLPDVQHGVTRRGGGISTGAYASLNLGLHVGDDAASVRENRRRAARELGFSLNEIVCATQVHGNRVARVTEHDMGRGATNQADALPNTDALITDTPGVLLALFFADCLPVFFACRTTRGVGIAHAGWRGLVAGVLENTVQAMVSEFQAAPHDLLTAIGPGIGVDNFIVEEEVATAFSSEVTQKRDGRYHIDLTAAARLRLLQSGIPTENITVASETTSAPIYFSHRRDRGQTGRMGGFIGLTSNQIT